MKIAHVCSLHPKHVAIVLVLGIIALSVGSASALEVITLRSGNAPMGNPDPMITVGVGSGAAPLSSVPFGPADFDQACDGPNAFVSTPHGAWAQGLECDPEARWIGIDANATPASALYCHTFRIQTECIDHASFSFCWTTDDILGDPAGGGPNPDGVYLNGVPISPSIFGGNYATQTVAPMADVTSLVVPGMNRLEIYNRDLGFIVSGVMYSARLEISECPVPTETTTWGAVKSLFD